MPTGFTVNGVDLDDWFDPYVQGDKPAFTGFKAGAQDLRDRYAPRIFGIQAPVTGFKISSGADLNTLFAKKGTAAYALPCDGLSANSHEILTNGETGYAIVQFTVSTNGTYTFQTVRSPNPSVNDTNVVSQDTWNTLGGSASGYQVRYTLSNIQYPAGTSAGVTVTNDADTFATISSGRTIAVRVDGTFTSGSHEVTADLTIELRRISDGLVFSTSIVHISAQIDGSV